MTRKRLNTKLYLLLLFSLTILWAGICNAVLAEVKSVFKSLTRQTLSKLNGNCQGSTELNYHSQELRSPDGKKSAYFDVVLRRQGQKNSRQLTYDQPIKCESYKLATPKGQIVATNNNIITKKSLSSISFEPNFEGIYLINPISFSANSRYLVVRLDVTYEALDAATNYVILDTQSYRPISIYPCEDSQFGANYKGFISQSEILFECLPGGTKTLEIINLQTQSIRKAAKNYKSGKLDLKHGSLIGQFTIIKRQQFPPK